MLCGFYAVIAVAALIATGPERRLLPLAGAGFLKDFALDLKANPATRSISADIALFAGRRRLHGDRGAQARHPLRGPTCSAAC